MTRVDWSEAAALALLAAAGSKADLKEVEAEVKSGEAQLWQASGSSDGFIVIRLEETPGGRLELVLVLGAGIGARAVIEQTKQWARQLNAECIRTHVTRPGLERIYRHLAFERAEVVMTWRPDRG